ncbi:MAG: hypothetical protein QOG99_3683, partial [Frankiales bacterium]|nr:hypothetical protein [Frankiales bacterium]
MPSTRNTTASPAARPRASLTAFGTVTCPFEVNRHCQTSGGAVRFPVQEVAMKTMSYTESRARY